MPIVPLRTEALLARRLGVPLAEIRRLIKKYRITAAGHADGVKVYGPEALEALRVASEAEREARP